MEGVMDIGALDLSISKTSSSASFLSQRPSSGERRYFDNDGEDTGAAAPPLPNTGNIVRVEKDDDDSSGGQELSLLCKCLVCGALATGIHFGAQSCSACCAFFRRAVAMRRSYKCHSALSGAGDQHAHTQQNSSERNEAGHSATPRCTISYTEARLCKACRWQKCLDGGMNPQAVHKRQPRSEQKPMRSFSTRSGLARNKRFAALMMQTTTAVSAANMECRTHTGQAEDSSRCSPTASSAFGQPGFCSPKPNDDENSSSTTSITILRVFIEEEIRIAERRRILFCERPVGNLLGAVRGAAAYTCEDIAPLRFCEFRRSVRAHILLVYEWLRVWPLYATLCPMDQITFLRKCVLYHTILDPCFITLQVGDRGKFVLQNGGYVATTPPPPPPSSSSTVEPTPATIFGDGWEDEEEISSENKKKIYRPLLALLTEIVDRMVALRLRFEEFVALKAMISIQMTLPDLSEAGRVAAKSQLTALLADLCRVMGVGTEKKSEQETYEKDTANNFVESHHQVTFFDLWQLDSLMLQFLKNRV